MGSGGASMKVVIADDEYLIQETLISMINELDQGWIIVGVASDGNELVDLIRLHKPDLAIVDIKMPYLSGLEAIQLTQQESPQMQCIVLTGYSEFSYAREALKLGAMNYLLKPVDSEELKSSLLTVKQTVQKRDLLNNKRVETAIISMGYGLISNLDDLDDQDLSELNYKVCVFFMDSGLEEKNQASQLLLFYRKVKDKLDLRVQAESHYAFIFLTNGELALISALHKDAKSAKDWEALIQEIETILQATCSEGFCLTMIETEPCSPFTLKESIDEINKASLLRILYGVNKRWQLNQWVKNQQQDELKLCKIILTLVKSFLEGSYANFINKTNELKEILDATQLFNDKSIRNAITHFLNNTILSSLSSSSLYGSWIQALKDHGEKLLAQIPRAERPQDIVQQALLIVEKNYMKDINILQLADELQVTPNYLSTVFHKKMDITFIKYLTRIRLIKAQQLLLETNAQVQEVAELVGYANPRYFTKLFTEFTGCYPSDYKKSCNRFL
jgi:two-component system response regulator YesN